METLLSILSGGIAGAILAFLLRGWITERLKQSIQHEYAQKLETHKAELNTRIQTISHENQLRQLRTSLFFDHQREAFAKVLTAIAEATTKWWKTANMDEGLTEPIPTTQYEAVKKAFYNNQLFLDSDCIAAVDLILDAMRDSFPADDGSGQLQYRDTRAAYDTVEFLQDRVAEVFQEKIGLDVPGRARHEIALLGGIRLLNRYHFADIGLPAKGALQLGHHDTTADAVRKAEDNREELLQKLGQFAEYLRKNPSCFSDASTKISRYVRMLADKEE